jgi:hypothetical protein
MSGRVVVSVVVILLLTPCARVFAQATPSTLHSFAATEAIGPDSLIQGKDGLFYGTAALGGSAQACTDYYGNAVGCCFDANNNPQACGTVFRVNADDSITVLYNFMGLGDGGMPTGLVQGGDGYLYGTTAVGGASINQTICDDPESSYPSPCCLDGNLNIVGCGTIFRISPSTPIPVGQPIDPLYSFYTADANGNFANTGAFPNPLIPGGTLAPGSTDSAFYGSALGCSFCSNANGMLFSLSVSGDGTAQVNSVYDFAAAKSSLLNPSALVEGSDGNLYGTTQMFGDSNCMQVVPAIPPNSPTYYGCGGAFVFDPATNTEAETDFTAAQGAINDTQTADGTAPLRAGPRPNAIVRQPQHNLPTGGPWSFPAVPVTLAETSDGKIYGSTPPTCANVYSSEGSIFTDDYESSPDCGAIAGNNSGEIYNPGTLFQLVPVTSGSTIAAPTVNTLYTFTQSGDGGGSLTGLTLGSDGDIYGSSGDETSADGLIFDVAPSSSPIGALPSVYTGSYAALVQGNDGNFYGVTADGELFEATPSSRLNAPVQLSFSANPFGAGSETTLSWAVTNAFSRSAQQCYAFAQSGAPGASSWTGLQQGTLTGKTFGGSISFTPTTPGTYTYAITCGGTESAVATLNVTLHPVTISETALPGGTVGTMYSATLTAAGGVGPYTWSLASGSRLPRGLVLNPSSGLISGTPTASGTFSFTVKVTDAESTPTTTTANFSITIAALPALTITQANLPSGTVNNTYSQMLTAVGGLKPYTWSLASGSSLPGGLKLNPSSGLISGTPTASGTFSFTVKVTDAESTPTTTTANFSIVVVQPLAIQAATLPQGMVGTVYSNSLAAAGGASPYAWSLASGSSLPPGLQLSAPTGAISGTPTASGTFSFTVMVTDAESTPATASANFSIVISPAPPAVTANPTQMTIAAPGDSGSTTLSFANFSGGAITVACSGLPSEADCNTTNATANSATLEIKTTAPVTAALDTATSRRFAFACFFPGLILAIGCARRRRWGAMIPVLLVLLAVGTLAGCGGSGSSTTTTNSNPGTPTGTSTVTVTATAGTQTAKAAITLVIQ